MGDSQTLCHLSQQSTAPGNATQVLHNTPPAVATYKRPSPARAKHLIFSCPCGLPCRTARGIFKTCSSVAFGPSLEPGPPRLLPPSSAGCIPAFLSCQLSAPPGAGWVPLLAACRGSTGAESPAGKRASAWEIVSTTCPSRANAFGGRDSTMGTTWLMFQTRTHASLPAEASKDPRKATRQTPLPLWPFKVAKQPPVAALQILR